MNNSTLLLKVFQDILIISSFSLNFLVQYCFKSAMTKNLFAFFECKTMEIINLCAILLTINRYVSNLENFIPESNVSALSNVGVGKGKKLNLEKMSSHEIENEPETVNRFKYKTARKPIKLTMRQGLMMNQVLAVYALENVENELCRNHVKEFKIGLRAFEPWALQMFDSSSKLQGGILLGNLMDFGSFSQCLHIYKGTEFGPIYGKHCVLKIKPEIRLIKKLLEFRNVSEKRFVKVYQTVEKSELAWSVCVPHTCPREDIFRHYNKVLMDMVEELNVSVNLDDNYCNTVFSQPVMGNIQYAVLLFLGSFMVLGIIAAILELTSDEGNNVFIDTFSAYRNLQRIMRIGRARKELHMLHGLKLFSSWCVVIGHRYIMYIMFPVINQLEELDWMVQLSSVAILGSTVSVDSFFMTSAMLVSSGFFEYVTRTGQFNLVLFYLHRYLRITLPLALVVLFYVTLPQFLGSGPLLYDVYSNHQKPCQDYWWSTLLHIQAYINPGRLCIYPIWYLSNEMVFYFLSPIVLYPLWKWPIFGYINASLLWILAISISFYYAWVNKYDGEVLPITNQLLETQYFTKYYVPPHMRAAPYIMGLAFGYVIFQTKQQKIKINRWVNITLWCISLAVMASTVIGSRNFYLEGHDFNRLEASVYLTFSRPAWTLGVMWIIWSCIHGYGGIINNFLSSDAFQVLGRITYGIFLIHTIVQLYKNGTAKAPLTFSNINVIFDGFADYFAVLIISLFFTVFYELPLVKAEGLLFKQRGTRVNP